MNIEDFTVSLRPLEKEEYTRYGPGWMFVAWADKTHVYMEWRSFIADETKEQLTARLRKWGHHVFSRNNDYNATVFGDLYNVRTSLVAPIVETGADK